MLPKNLQKYSVVLLPSNSLKRYELFLENIVPFCLYDRQRYKTPLFQYENQCKIGTFAPIILPKVPIGTFSKLIRRKVLIPHSRVRVLFISISKRKDGSLDPSFLLLAGAEGLTLLAQLHPLAGPFQAGFDHGLLDSPQDCLALRPCPLGFESFLSLLAKEKTGH